MRFLYRRVNLMVPAAGALLIVACLLIVQSRHPDTAHARNLELAPAACPVATYGAIGAVHYAYGGDSGRLGCATTAELRVSDGKPAGKDEAVDKYQEFQKGAIYYNHTEGGAYALMSSLNARYRAAGGASTYGLPITSQINEDPYCKGYFAKGFVHCDGTQRLWANMSDAERQAALHLPYLRLPYAGNTAVFNSGPHAWNEGGVLNSTHATTAGSGLDFSGTSMDVLAMASGTVIDVKRPTCNAAGLGCWVAIRNDFSGTVVVYGHLPTIPQYVSVGVWIKQGTIIGNTGTVSVGNSGGPHVHVELRDGADSCTNNCEGDHGNPVDWTGVMLDSHLIAPFHSISSGLDFAYDGAAVITKQDPTQKHDIMRGQWPETGFQVAELRFYDKTKNAKNEWVNAAQLSKARVFVTSTVANACSSRPVTSTCIDNSIDSGRVIFDIGGTWNSDNTPITPTPGAAAAGAETYTADGAPRLTSTNVAKGFEPRYTPGYPGDPPPPGGAGCPTDGREGVYFFAGKNYQPPCTFSTVDVADFGTTAIGDNALQSVQMIGGWQVKLYGTTNFGPPYEELNSSEADISWRSLGGQISSARVTNKSVQSDCEPSDRPGVYLYADRDYQGACYYANADINNLAQTFVGDNNVSSARLVGLYTVKLYEDPHLSGRYKEINVSDPDLDSESLGGAYSSLRFFAQPGADLISNIYAASGKPYELAKCRIGRTYYIDRTYTITSVSNVTYDGLWCIKTSNDDAMRDDRGFLTFDLNRNATIYIYFDRRMTSPPGWTSTLYNQNSKQIYTSDGPMDYFVVYSCKSQPGTITLGGPHYNGGSGARSMYVVAFREEDSADQFCQGYEPEPTPTYTPAPTGTATPVFPPTATPTPAMPELASASIFVDRSQIGPGSAAQVTMLLYNGGGPAGVQIRSQLPNELSYVDGSATNGAVYNSATRAVEWQGILQNSETLVVNYGVQAASDVAMPRQTQLQMWVSDGATQDTTDTVDIVVAPEMTATPTPLPTAPPGNPENRAYIYLPVVRP